MADSQTLKERLKAFAIEAGVDSLGVASVDAYTAMVPNGQFPAHSAAGMRSIIVFAKHNLSGSMALHDVSTQSYNSHLALDAVIDLTARLAEWMEAEGHLALPLHPEFIDEDLKRSGAGLLDFKHVAEFSGLGHIGLNLNFLTPEYGSRVYLGVLLTSSEMPPDSRGADLCPGMKCGRCAVVCPTKAIPLSADRDAHVDTYRNLHQDKCSEGAMRLSIRTLFRVLRLVLARREQLPPDKVFADKYWRDFWIALNSKRGANAACFECMYVCPIGNEDARAIFAVPYRGHDIQGGKVTHIRTETTHAVEHVGPPPDRVHEYSRHLVFANQSADEAQS
jgi:ferredoxin